MNWCVTVRAPVAVRLPVAFPVALPEEAAVALPAVPLPAAAVVPLPRVVRGSDGGHRASIGQRLLLLR